MKLRSMSRLTRHMQRRISWNVCLPLQHPSRHSRPAARPATEVPSGGIRELIVGRYRLLYSISDDDVVILALVHQRRDVDRWRKL